MRNPTEKEMTGFLLGLGIGLVVGIVWPHLGNGSSHTERVNQVKSSQAHAPLHPEPEVKPV